MIEYFGNRLVKQGRDVFSYTGTHWKILTDTDHDRLKVMIQRICGGLADLKLIEPAYQLFIIHLPVVPDGVDLFAPNPSKVNFLNGTLHLTRGGDRKYQLRFTEHRPEDYVINILPYEYRPGDQSRNAEFDAMLERISEGDPDKAEKIRAVRQMYGACLVPLFPHLFMCYGPAGTGKSTILNIAARLVHRDNLCDVPPSEFKGFGMETMAGKLVNISTDIPFDMPMRDEIVKQIIDRKPMRIQRKRKVDVYAPIPAVHLFGGNDIPKALDGVSKAHDRRWTFLEFSKFVPKGSYTMDYWDYCYEISPQGILNFALEGLMDLIEERGHFTVPESGKRKMEAWQLASDPVGQFLVDIDQGEVADGNNKLIRGPGAQIERKKLWDCFVKWYEHAFNFPPKLGKIGFFDVLRHKKLKEKKIRGVDYFEGIGLEVENSAQS
jgi:phage/plasmid-associated DNA primase